MLTNFKNDFISLCRFCSVISHRQTDTNKVFWDLFFCHIWSSFLNKILEFLVTCIRNKRWLTLRGNIQWMYGLMGKILRILACQFVMNQIKIKKLKNQQENVGNTTWEEILDKFQVLNHSICMWIDHLKCFHLCTN